MSRTSSSASATTTDDTPADSHQLPVASAASTVERNHQREACRAAAVSVAAAGRAADAHRKSEQRKRWYMEDAVTVGVCACGASAGCGTRNAYAGPQPHGTSPSATQLTAPREPFSDVSGWVAQQQNAHMAPAAVAAAAGVAGTAATTVVAAAAAAAEVHQGNAVAEGRGVVGLVLPGAQQQQPHLPAIPVNKKPSGESERTIRSKAYGDDSSGTG